jgi:hypothetical protein
LASAKRAKPEFKGRAGKRKDDKKENREMIDLNRINDGRSGANDRKCKSSHCRDRRSNGSDGHESGTRVEGVDDDHDDHDDGGSVNKRVIDRSHAIDQVRLCCR